MQWAEVKRLFHWAIDLPAEERGDLLRTQCDDQEILKQVESLLTAHESAEDFISQPALVEAGLASCDGDGNFFGASFVGKRIANYDIVRELGRGGMGTVFLAARADFNRQVALKIIKRGMDTEAILQRFVFERQVLANLQHPNIAGFLDGGTTEDGLPFFVMEYVDGEPITKYCDAHQLDTAARLKLFQKACGAVRHAHQNLIVHRDLKPSNILVTRDGIPKLLDFGIAKLLTSDRAGEAAQTATAFRVMTPEYASPEHIRGLPITTSTDVYSLGVVLYELLSGHRPFRFAGRAPEEVARIVLTTDPLPPSEAITQQVVSHPTITDSSGGRTNATHSFRNAKELRGDLDNIVLKALRKERERRYASVPELSEDIRRYLAGLPVSARADTFTYRAGKFIQRHRAGVAMAALLILVLVTATAVTSWQAHVARREHAKLEMRSIEQRKLANSLITEVQRSLKEVPHSLPAQRMLAQKSIEYLNNLTKDAGDDPQFLGELAEAYHNLGYLQAWTLQDNPNALLTYEKAIELGRRRLVLEPKNVSARRQLADIMGGKIESLNLMQRPEDSAATFVDKMSVEEQLLNEQPESPERLMWVAESSQAYGETLLALKRDEEANAKFRISVDLAKRSIDLFKAEPVTPQQRVDLSLMMEKLASMLDESRQLAEATQTYREAVAIASAVHAEHPEIVQALRNTTSSHWYLGMLLDRQGDHPGAIENYRASLRTVMDAMAADPSVDPQRGGEMKYNVVLGRALCKVGKNEEGVPLIRHGVDLAMRLVESDKENRQDEYWGTELLTWAVEGLAAANLRDEGRQISLKMIGWAEDTSQNAPGDGGPRLRLAKLYEQLGDVYSGYDAGTKKLEGGDQAGLIEARAWYEKSLDCLRDIDQNYNLSKTILQDYLTSTQQKISQCDERLHH
jgi:eukaryotic-like serine/threonine-protein kinase